MNVCESFILKKNNEHKCVHRQQYSSFTSIYQDMHPVE